MAGKVSDRFDLWSLKISLQNRTLLWVSDCTYVHINILRTSYTVPIMSIALNLIGTDPAVIDFLH